MKRTLTLFGVVFAAFLLGGCSEWFESDLETYQRKTAEEQAKDKYLKARAAREATQAALAVVPPPPPRLDVGYRRGPYAPRGAHGYGRSRARDLRAPVPPPRGRPRVIPYTVSEFGPDGQAYCNKYMPGARFRGWVGSGSSRKADCMY